VVQGALSDLHGVQALPGEVPRQQPEEEVIRLGTLYIPYLLLLLSFFYQHFNLVLLLYLTIIRLTAEMFWKHRKLFFFSLSENLIRTKKCTFVLEINSNFVISVWNLFLTFFLIFTPQKIKWNLLTRNWCNLLL
jgi:hypothetical protein